MNEPHYYGKRPLWHWIIIYLIIGAIVYGAVYYFVFAKRSGTPNKSSPKILQY